MTVRKRRVVEAALKAKGMTSTDSHHIMFTKDLDGVTHLITRISHGADEISDTLAKRMANQCYLHLREFWQLVDCPLSEEQWDTLIRKRSASGRNPFLS